MWGRRTAFQKSSLLQQGRGRKELKTLQYGNFFSARTQPRFYPDSESPVKAGPWEHNPGYLCRVRSSMVPSLVQTVSNYMSNSNSAGNQPLGTQAKQRGRKGL